MRRARLKRGRARDFFGATPMRDAKSPHFEGTSGGSSLLNMISL
jgi:hypothetical protein